MTTEHELERQMKDFEESSKKLIDTMLNLATEKGKFEGMKMTGTPEDLVMLKDQVKVTVKAISEVLQWLIKLSVLNMTATQLLVQEMTKDE